jgi:hypothetical protein
MLLKKDKNMNHAEHGSRGRTKPHAGAVNADLIAREYARANNRVPRHRETTPIARAGVG